jgi:uncharacterized protein with von Willebrand factor type A (vWA) domain
MSPAPAPPPDLADVAARLGRRLHDAGIPVTAERSGRLAAMLALRAPATQPELYWTARVTLLSGQEQVQVFDRIFAHLFSGMIDPADWRGGQPPPPPPRARRAPSPPSRSPRQAVPPSGPGPGPRPAPTAGEGSSNGAEHEAVTAAVSTEERLRRRDFATLDDEELAALRALTGRMAFAPPPRRRRRHIRTNGGSELDIRATLRRARRTGGEPLTPVRRRPRSRPRRLVLICDISGSMEAYARAYLQLLMSGVGGAGAEAFVFATRLTRLTRDLRSSTPAAALERAGRAAPDWSGGTRIGEAIKTFTDDHGRRGVARGAVVVIISDGWDRGDPALLGREMARLRRLARRVIWVNPRQASRSYHPLTAGMAAAVPHIDRFLSGHTLEAFDEVLAAIGEDDRPWRRPP